jgi:hypothetical protein
MHQIFLTGNLHSVVISTDLADSAGEWRNLHNKKRWVREASQLRPSLEATRVEMTRGGLLPHGPFF